MPIIGFSYLRLVPGAAAPTLFVLMLADVLAGTFITQKSATNTAIVNGVFMTGV